ncbi:MAG TPA: NAD(P)-binding domain-containing protein [Acidimicrobiales bacterium]|nr:NAD(P)-binding domain-containing protein [Acidimicrobiales bacterium]
MDTTKHPTAPSLGTAARSDGQAQGDNGSAPTVAVLGAGTTGSAVTHRLLQTGHRVRVRNRSAGPFAVLAAEWAETFEDAGAAVARVPVVPTLLPTAEVVSAVMLESGLLEALAPSAVSAPVRQVEAPQPGPAAEGSR